MRRVKGRHEGSDSARTAHRYPVGRVARREVAEQACDGLAGGGGPRCPCGGTAAAVAARSEGCDCSRDSPCARGHCLGLCTADNCAEGAGKLQQQGEGGADRGR